AEVAVEDPRLEEARAEPGAVELRKHVAVDDQDVRPPVIVEICETAPPPDPAPVPSQTRSQSAVDEGAAAGVVVQRRGFVREVRLENIEPAVAVEVSGGDPHAGACLAVRVVGAAGKDTGFLERAVALV